MEFISLKKEKTYQKNIKSLEKYYPDLYLRIKDSNSGNWKIVRTAQKGVYNTYSPDRDLFFYNEDPVSDIQHQFKQLNLKNTRLAVFWGMGLGYELAFYVKKLMSKQRTAFMLIVEEDLEMFNNALQVTDITELIQHERVKFLIGCRQEDLYPKLRQYILDQNKFYFLKAIKPVYHTSSMLINKEYYLQVLKHIAQAGKDTLLDFGNSPEDSLIGIENMLANLEEIILNPGINMLFNQFKDRPAVIVSAGPSLNINKHLLKGLEDKALIICPDASLKILLDMGIKPHLVTSLERTPGTLRFVKDLQYEDTKDVYFAACPVINNNTYKAYPGPRIIVYRQLAHFKWLDIERGTLEVRKSSGNMAFKVAEALGCSPVILIGQDLAFSRDGRTHAAGTLDKDGKARETQEYYNKIKTFEVMGNDGKPILTSEMWYSFLKAYEYDLARYKGLCINCTEGGAFIPGTTVMSFAEAIGIYLKETFNPLSQIKQIIGNFTADSQAEEFEKIERLLNRTIADFGFVIDACAEGLDIINQNKPQLEDCIVENLTDKQIRTLLDIEQKIIQCRRKVMKSCPGYDLILLHVIQSYLVNFEIDYNATFEMYANEYHALVENILRCAAWFETIRGLTKICMTYMEKALMNVDYLKGEECERAIF